MKYWSFDLITIGATSGPTAVALLLFLKICLSHVFLCFVCFCRLFLFACLINLLCLFVRSFVLPLCLTLSLSVSPSPFSPSPSASTCYDYCQELCHNSTPRLLCHVYCKECHNSTPPRPRLRTKIFSQRPKLGNQPVWRPFPQATLLRASPIPPAILVREAALTRI